ncbi:hypothetical protein AFFFEF_01939 [Methylorubrum extorquens]
MSPAGSLCLGHFGVRQKPLAAEGVNESAANEAGSGTERRAARLVERICDGRVEVQPDDYGFISHVC